MKLRRRKSRTARAAEAAGKTAKGVRKSAKGIVAYQVAKGMPMRPLPLIAGASVGAGLAAALAARRLRSGGPSAATP